VTCTATDRNGNVAKRSFNVIVRTPTTPGAVTDPVGGAVLESVETGQHVRVSAGGFAPKSRLSLVFVAASGKQIFLRRVPVGLDGRFDAELKIPRNAVPGASQMTAVGVDAAGADFVRAWLLTVS
jgi:hypothetical protein